MITEDPIDQAGKRGRFECVSTPEYGAAAKRRKASLSFSLSHTRVGQSRYLIYRSRGCHTTLHRKGFLL
jgi:hypothetical protein